MYSTLFDLMAVVYSIIVDMDGIKPKGTMTGEKSDTIEKRARWILRDINPDKKYHLDGDMRVNSQIFNAIIECCKQESDPLIVRSVLCQLDLLIDINATIAKYDLYKYDEASSHSFFHSLNSNVDESKVTIIPNVQSFPNTFHIETNFGGDDKEYTNEHCWHNNVNYHLNNTICIRNNSLRDYKIRNIIIDLFKNRQKEQLVIGVTPCCNTSADNIMYIEKGNDKTGEKRFSVKEYYEPDALTARFLNTLELAKEHKIDILLGTEMLGTSKLSETNIYGYNQLFRDYEGRPPYIIVTPSFWSAGKNYISAFLNTGKLIGRQYKQNAFRLKDETNEYKGDFRDAPKFAEDLKDYPKEILLIHIPGLGRISFSICIDYLVDEYRDILVRELKSDFVFCPSYTTGVVPFINASGEIRSYGARFIWINSCSALRKHYIAPKIVGKVTAPVTSPEDLSFKADKDITPNCDGNCSKTCMFKIAIQLKTKDGKLCNEININHLY